MLWLGSPVLYLLERFEHAQQCHLPPMPAAEDADGGQHRYLSRATSLTLFCPRCGHFDVEMKCRLFRSQRLIERDCRSILQVGLHEDNVCVARCGDLPKRAYHSGGDALAPMPL